nr:MAG TPA: hypothetical protein [Bacteriophage sp.]
MAHSIASFVVFLLGLHSLDGLEVMLGIKCRSFCY